MGCFAGVAVNADGIPSPMTSTPIDGPGQQPEWAEGASF
jgi:hypothetical protein|tara:strand:+ start:1603 stop:1719 length:117 start_codon:yes stop_codon:yes gene_type:complete